ncbi:MAG: hypothetical protein II662_02830 [Bacteroidales bacterium]|nr:hypothetical protein [Bacteroidales bacterium]
MYSPAYADYKELPSWFFNPYGVIGVSDMDLDSVTAVNQAVVRAMFMHAISQKLSMSSVYELYYHMENDGNNNIDDQKSHCLAEFETSISGYGYDIIDIGFTKYKEAIVLLNVYNDYDENNEKSANFNGSYMFYFDGTIRNPEYGDTFVLDMSAPGEDINNLKWLSKTEGRYSVQTSTIDSITNNVIERYYSYGAGGSVPKNVVNQNTRHGLWHSIADTFMQAMTNFIPQKATIKSTNRMITDYQSLNQSADYRDKVQDIVRMTFKTDLSCRINGIECENGVMYVDWDVSELNKADVSFSEQSNYIYESHGYQAVVGYDKSKARNESRRIALISAENEIAKMANFRISEISNDFSISQDNDYYQRYTDTAQISTKLVLKDVQEIVVSEPELQDGVYCSKIKAKINKNCIIPLGDK